MNESQKALLWYNEGIINTYLHQNAKKIITKYGDILVKCKVIDVTHDEQLENAKDWNYKNLEDIDIIYDDSKQGLNATNVSLAANDEDSFQLIDNIYTFSKDVYSWKNNNKFTFTKNSIGMDNYSYEFNTEVWKSLEALKDVLNTRFRIEKDISGISYIKKKENIVE